MVEGNDDKLTSGYSTTMMAAGAMTHLILLRKGTVVVVATIIATGEKEIGRTFLRLSPAPEPKKGWF